MKASQIYLKAAEAVAQENQETCIAIADAGYGDNRACYDCYPEPKKYTVLFAPDESGYRYTDWLDGQFRTAKEKHDWRVLALLFMHEIAKDEELI